MKMSLLLRLRYLMVEGKDMNFVSFGYHAVKEKRQESLEQKASSQEERMLSACNASSNRSYTLSVF
jgi:hypothetical protein